MRRAINRLPALPTTVAIDAMFSEQDILHLAEMMPCYTHVQTACGAYWECANLVARSRRATRSTWGEAFLARKLNP